MIGTDCLDSCKSNYHTIMTTTAPFVGGSQYLVEEVKLGFQLDDLKNINKVKTL